MRTEQIPLLKADPDLGALLAEPRRSDAERRLLVSTHRLAVGPWDVSRLSGASADHIGLLVLDGVIARELIVADHVSAELLGPGDLIRPWQAASKSELLPVDAEWSVLSPSTLAVLDRRFAAEVSQYPEITAALFDRLSERSLRLATTQAISQLTRVDRRLKALFWHLAERWGRVGGAQRAGRARRAGPPRRRLVAPARRSAGCLDARALPGPPCPRRRPAASHAAVLAERGHDDHDGRRHLRARRGITDAFGRRLAAPGATRDAQRA
jgi:hypothetical protein